MREGEEQDGVRVGMGLEFARVCTRCNSATVQGALQVRQGSAHPPVKREHEIEDRIDRRPNGLEEEHEADHSRHLRKSERVVEIGRVDEAAKGHESTQHVDLRDQEVLQHVAVRPVADLMAQHRHEFFRAHLFDERVEYNDHARTRTHTHTITTTTTITRGGQR